MVRQGENAHAAGSYGTDDGGNSRTLNAQFREAEMAVDEQIVADDVHAVGDNVGAHSDLGVSSAPLSCIDDHGDHVEDHSAGDDAEVGDGRGVGVFCCSCQAENRFCKYDSQQADHDRQHKGDEERLNQDAVGAFPVAFALSPCDDGGNGYVHGDKNGEANEFRLSRQAHGGDGIRTQRADHDGVNHAH